MTKFLPSSDSDAIAAVAAQWVARRDAGLNAAETAELRRWLDADPRHAAALEHYASAWSAFDRPSGAPAVLGSLGATLARRRHRRLTGVAAGCVLLFGAGLAWRFHGAAPPQLASRQLPPTARLIVPEQRVLPDGSVAELRAGSRIAVDYSGPLRRVALVKGEAHFKVAKNKERAFIVSAGGIEVRAVGTAFDVQLGSHQVDVLVTEGRVSVARADQSAARPLALVDAGARVAVPAAADSAPIASPVQPVPADELAERLAWRSPRLEFSATPLAEAVELMNRAASPSGAPGSPAAHLIIDPASAQLAREPISGLFRPDNSGAFVRMLELSLGVKAEYRPSGEIVLRSAP